MNVIELQNIVSNNNKYFYKINMNGNFGQYIYDSYVDTPLFFPYILRKLDKMTIEFVTPDGNPYDFNNIDHTFVLEIVTLDKSPLGTHNRKK